MRDVIHEGGEKRSPLSEEGEAVEYCHAESMREWRSVAEGKDKERGEKRKPSEQLPRLKKERGGVSGLSWSMANCRGHGLVPFTWC